MRLLVQLQKFKKTNNVRKNRADRKNEKICRQKEEINENR